MKLLTHIQQDEDDGGIDLTPMLDVVFIMLIFFIVTASFIKEAGLELNKPDVQQAAPSEESKSIVVRIAADGQIFIGPRRIDIRSVRPNIERLHAEQPGAPVVIQADKDARNRVLVTVMDAARLAGVADVSLAPAH
ncbi:MAG: biopolymer transporter ExbD [Gammaproteobacteria bacterium]|nr:biopolymer transporter ExbD [Gammaproteobacteria bacterium]